MTTVPVAVPRKGRPLEAVLDRIAAAGLDGTGEIADEVVSTLRYEKAVAKGTRTPDSDVYDRLARYSDLARPARPEFTLVRDARDGHPRRIVFDSLDVPLGDVTVRLVGRDEPFRALRAHEFALGFDSADLVLEEVVELRPDPVSELDDLNERIDPRESDVRVVGGLGDVVDHSLLATRDTFVSHDGPLDRSFVRGYGGPFCISPRYERLVEAVLGTDAAEGIEFVYPDGDVEEAAIADTGVGAYLTVSGGTARDHGLVLGERLFPSETVLLETGESPPGGDAVRQLVGDGSPVARALAD